MLFVGAFFCVAVLDLETLSLAAFDGVLGMIFSS